MLQLGRQRALSDLLEIDGVPELGILSLQLLEHVSMFLLEGVQLSGEGFLECFAFLLSLRGGLGSELLFHRSLLLAFSFLGIELGADSPQLLVSLFLEDVGAV